MKRLWLSVFALVAGAACLAGPVTTRTSWPTPEPGRVALELKVEEHLERAERERRLLRLLDLAEAAARDPHAFRTICAVKRLILAVGSDGKDRELGLNIKDTDLVERINAAEKVFDRVLEGKE